VACAWPSSLSQRERGGEREKTNRVSSLGFILFGQKNNRDKIEHTSQPDSNISHGGSPLTLALSPTGERECQAAATPIRCTKKGFFGEFSGWVGGSEEHLG
jgi:hypothetical protein